MMGAQRCPMRTFEARCALERGHLGRCLWSKGAVRQRRVLDAVGSRIASHGDMPIRVHRLTLRTIGNMAGLGDWEYGQDDFREVDALALDMLRAMADRHR